MILLITAAVLGGTLFANALSVRAQATGRVQITSIETSAFPSLSVQFEAYDDQGQFIQDLLPADVTLYENELEQTVDSLEIRNPGVQFTLAINGGPD
ncbi:MAG: hypothetical protein EOM66_10730, partial [Clostridia bacterium]|nr:hypothetical protein [Clostridia bacterium]